MEERTTTIDDLLRHEAFVRGVARALVGDRHRAEDLAQETWVAAVRTPGTEPRRPRA